MINSKYTPCIHSYTYLECEDCQRWVFGIEANILAKDSLHITNSGCHAFEKSIGALPAPIGHPDRWNIDYNHINSSNTLF
ncbi:MAG TPA: hypothetical protein VJ991_02600 [Balneolales bacterium]|nr:hypothetical protein [Balneolales bacterium]